MSAVQNVEINEPGPGFFGQLQVVLKKNDLGASGVLYYTLETSDFTDTKKMVLLQK